MTQETTTLGIKDKDSIHNGSKRVCKSPTCLINSVELDNNKQESLLLRLHMHCTSNFPPNPLLRNRFHKRNRKGIDAL